jgi:importin-4
MPADHQTNPTIIELTPKILPIFTSVLSDPIEQLDDSTRLKVIATVKFIAQKNPSLIQGNETLMNCVRG